LDCTLQDIGKIQFVKNCRNSIPRNHGFSSTSGVFFDSPSRTKKPGRRTGHPGQGFCLFEQMCLISKQRQICDDDGDGDEEGPQA